MKAKHGETTFVMIDESTNALDAPTECRILSHFCSAAKQRGQTLIVVTHRPQDLSVHADKIMCVNFPPIPHSKNKADLKFDSVIENGSISAQGTHEEMKILSNFYASLLPGTPK